MAYRVRQSNSLLKLCEICMIGLFSIYVFVEVIKRKLRCFGFYVLIDDLTSRACSVIDTICGYSLDLLIDEA